MKNVGIVLLGVGQRGSLYAECASKNRFVHIKALCDNNVETLNKYAELYSVPKAMRFTDENELFKAGRLAETIAISTLDKSHYAEAVKAIELGYDILLEKPISPDAEASGGQRREDRRLPRSSLHSVFQETQRAYR